MRSLILLVDDDRDFLEMNRGILEAQGFQVRCFTDTDGAWESIENRKPDLVITDLMMKSINSGFSLARKIKSDRRYVDLPVIIVTAIASRRGFDFNPQTRGELEVMGCEAYFDKPVSPDLLIAKVEELLS
jgi:CheY-like chemotaxis protein